MPLYSSIRRAAMPGCDPGMTYRVGLGSATPHSHRRLVLAECLAHHSAHLTDRGAVSERVLQRVEEIAAALDYLAKVLQPTRDRCAVAIFLEALQPLHLVTLGLRVDAQDL